MARPGPRPAPAHLKLLRGETRPSRVNRNEPKAPVAGPVVAPDYLDADARAVWARLAPTLTARGLLTEWDVDLFAAFCTAVVHHRRAVQLVNSTAVTVRTQNGLVVRHPAMAVVRSQAALVTSLGARFGLSPSDRASISLAPEEVDHDDVLD
jgi:P27 family predicted phage terminase small subunit